MHQVPTELSFSDRWSSGGMKTLRIARLFAPLNFRNLLLMLNINWEIVPFSSPVTVAMIYLLPTLFHYFVDHFGFLCMSMQRLNKVKPVTLTCVYTCLSKSENFEKNSPCRFWTYKPLKLWLRVFLAAQMVTFVTRKSLGNIFYTMIVA